MALFGRVSADRVARQEAEQREIFRRLLVSLGQTEGEGSVIGVTSAVRGEGRTTVALGLARTLAADLDVPVFLVEGDLDNPSLADRLNLAPSPGLADVLEGRAQLEEATRSVSDNLMAIPAGRIRGAAAPLLRQLPSLPVFAERSSFRGPSIQGVTVLDLPPVLGDSYTVVAAGVTDSLVLVVRAGVTPVEMVREAVALLDETQPAGIVLNGQSTAIPSWLALKSA